MAATKKTEIPKMFDDAEVKVAQQKLLDVQARFEQAANYPLTDDLPQRAQALLDGTKLQTKREPDEVELLRAAARMALGRLQDAQRTAAEKIIKDTEPNYKKVREELLTECLRFKEALMAHDDFIQSLWTAGLYDFLPAAWSKKAPVVQIYPRGRLDELISNLQIDVK